MAAQFDLPPGTMLGKYEVVRKLAMGGMAEIYLARVRGSAGFEKLVVIKRILPTVADDPKFVQMFLDEARLAATLQHPNIADVYEVGDHEGAPFFAMEFIHGQDVRSIRLAARERKERIPLAIALAIVHGAANALDFAHERCGPDGVNLGLVHRDVSSSNVLVSYEGAIKLIDFGIARATGSSHKTQTGTLKGKIPYMSPEQCRGLPLDRRSDLFSLGVLMYELTAGQRPFRGENDFAIMDQIVHQGAKPPSTLVRGYPAELDAIVMKLLARNVDERYQSAEAMIHDLDPFLAQHRLWVSARPLSRYMRTVFEERVSAWDQASQNGESLAQHLSTITSRSQASELITPPSAFPAVLPLSQEMAAVHPPSGEMDAVAPPAELAMAPSAPVRAVVDMPSRPTEYPSLRPSRAKTVLAVAGIGVLASGGYLAFTYVQHDADSIAAPAAVPAAAAPAPAPPVTPDPRPEPAPAPAPAPVPAAKLPAPEPTIAAPAPKPPVTVAVPAKKQQPAVAPPPPKRVPPPRHVVPTKSPPPADKEPPKEPAKDKEPKDQQWNLDSPFLPPAQH